MFCIFVMEPFFFYPYIVSLVLRKFCRYFIGMQRSSHIRSGRESVQSIFRPDNENFLSVPSSVSRSFELLQLASVWTFQQHVQTILSVRQTMRFLSKTQTWEDRCNRSNDVDSRPNALMHKASIAFKIQMSLRSASWLGRASIRYGNCLH
jgi:hypothetical protein